MEERIVELEKKTGHQDQMLVELNEVVVEQQRQINEMQKQLMFFQESFEAGDLVRKHEDEQPPPHW